MEPPRPERSKIIKNYLASSKIEEVELCESAFNQALAAVLLLFLEPFNAAADRLTRLLTGRQKRVLNMEEKVSKRLKIGPFPFYGKRFLFISRKSFLPAGRE